MKNGKTILKILCIACVLQILLTLYLVLKIYMSTVIRPDQIQVEYGMVMDLAPETLDNDLENEVLGSNIGPLRGVLSKVEVVEKIEIWGKAAIASYLWEHILEGSKMVDSSNPSIYTGQIMTQNCLLSYKEGPGLQPESLPSNLSKIVLVINGRTDEKIVESKKWLNALKGMTKVLLVALGNEECNNQWLETYIHPNGPVQGVFITYDDTAIDDKLFLQWPLGVATYRHFPVLNEGQVLPSQPRKYICNLQATNHVNSSRTRLFHHIKSHPLARDRCHVIERKMWESSESTDSMNDYISILVQSDLTLCPAGFNSETYRVYEALSAGSVPVMEDKPSSGSCDSNSSWRLFKQYNSPVIWVSSWDELPMVLREEQRLTPSQKIERRKKLLSWYEWFKVRNRDRFLSFVHSKLLKSN